MPGVRQGVQPELQPHHSQPQAHRLQALRLRPMWEGLPEEGGPQAAPGDAARAQMSGWAAREQQSHNTREGCLPTCHHPSLTSQAPQVQSAVPTTVGPLHLTSWSCQRGQMTFSVFILEWEPNDSLGLEHTEGGSSTPEDSKLRGDQMKSGAPYSFPFSARLHRGEGPLSSSPRYLHPRGGITISKMDTC